MPEIILENVQKKFGDFTAVEDLNLRIDDRSFVTLLGPSGCGKTTTLRMIAGLESPTAGTITIGGVTVFDAEKGINLPPDKRDVGFLFQNYALWPHMTVYKNIAFGLENLKWKKDAIDARVTELLEMLKISEFAKRYPNEISGGQQQRVAIARTLAPGPKVLFMDEPLSNLDAQLRGEMRTELKRLHADTNSTFVYVTHDQLEAMTLSTKVCLMQLGVLQQYAPPLDIYRQPDNVFVAEFMGNPTMNFIDATTTTDASGQVVVSFLGVRARFRPVAVDSEIPARVTIGVRPEHIHIHERGGVAATAYTTLPAGLETTVKVMIDGQLLSVVVFGTIDYEVDQPLLVDFAGDGLLLFDQDTRRRVAIGALALD